MVIMARGARGAALAIWLAAASASAQPGAREPGRDRLILRDYPDEPAQEATTAGAVPTAAPDALPGAAASTTPTAPGAAPAGAPRAAPPPVPLPPQLYYDMDGRMLVPGPEVLPYREEQGVPYGYETEMEHGPKGAIIAGVVIFLSSYVATLNLFLMASMSSADDESHDGEDLRIWLVPVVGPFLGAGTGESHGAVGPLLGLGAGQVLGATILGFGLAFAGQRRLVKRDLQWDDAWVVPLVLDRGGGGGVSGRF